MTVMLFGQSSVQVGDPLSCGTEAVAIEELSSGVSSQVVSGEQAVASLEMLAVLVRIVPADVPLSTE